MMIGRRLGKQETLALALQSRGCTASHDIMTGVWRIYKGDSDQVLAHGQAGSYLVAREMMIKELMVMEIDGKTTRQNQTS